MFPHKTTQAAALLAISPITVLLNLSLIISFIATKQVTQNTSNILIFVISLYDLVAGAFTLPLTASILLNEDATDICVKSKILIMLNGNGKSSFSLTILLALDRYLHMSPDIHNRPTRITMILKAPNIYVVVVAMFITANAISAVIAFVLYREYTISFYTTLSGTFSILLVILACLYIKGYLRIRKFVANNPVYNDSTRSARTTPDYIRKLYKTVLVILSLALIQHVPYCIISIIAALHHDPVKLSSNAAFPYFFELAALSAYAGSFTNCVAILHFNNQAKKWIFSKTGIHWITQQCRKT